MKESLRHNYQVTIIGGVIVLIIGAIITPPLTKYFKSEKDNSNSLNSNNKTQSTTYNKELENTIASYDSSKSDGIKAHFTDSLNKRRMNSQTNEKPVVRHVNHQEQETKPVTLEIPQLLSPPNNSDIDYPRHTTLEWSRIENAIGYKVAIEYQAAETSEWTDLNAHVKHFNDYVEDNTVLKFIGAGMGQFRWRVKAIGKNGRESAFSPWRYINYTN